MADWEEDEAIFDSKDRADDDDVAESWEDYDSEEEAKKKAAAAAEAAKKAAPPRVTKKQQQDAEAKKKAEEAARTPEELLEAKMRQQRLTEEADFALTTDLFKGTKKDNETSIELMLPKTKKDFDEFAAILADKITQFEKSPHYVGFLNELIKKCTDKLKSEQVRDISSAVTVIMNQKLKDEKPTSKKKKASGAGKLNVERDDMDFADKHSAYAVDDDYGYDDFM